MKDGGVRVRRMSGKDWAHDEDRSGPLDLHVAYA